MIMLADVGNVAGEARDRLAAWIDDGGMLVRFAGPRLAASDDDLVPVKLRRGGRTLGGSLSWDQPQPLAAFSREGPFDNMPVPKDVTVTRQVLAEPEAGLVERTWATLADGTPLVTAVKRGKGMIVLFHVTADTRWSDLPLSGTLRRHAAPDRRPCRHDRDQRSLRQEQGRARGGAADAHSRRLRRVRSADRDDPPGPGRLCCARHRRPPAGLLRPARRIACREHTCPDRPSCRDRLRAAARAARSLSGRRAAGPARPGADGGARPARARRAGGVPARRRDRPDHAPAPACGRDRARGRSCFVGAALAAQRAAVGAERHKSAPTARRRPPSSPRRSRSRRGSLT